MLNKKIESLKSMIRKLEDQKEELGGKLEKMGEMSNFNSKSKNQLQTLMAELR